MTASPTPPRHVRVRRHSALRPSRTAAIPIEGLASEYDLAAERLAQSPSHCMACREPVDGGLFERRRTQERIVLEVWPACRGCMDEVERRAAVAPLPPLLLRVNCQMHPDRPGEARCSGCQARAFCDEECRVLAFFLRGVVGCTACCGPLLC